MLPISLQILKLALLNNCNQKNVSDDEEGEVEEHNGSNGDKNKVVDENTTQHDHVNIFEKINEMFGLF